MKLETVEVSERTLGLCHHVCVSTEIVHIDSSLMKVDNFYNLMVQFSIDDGRECIVSRSWVQKTNCIDDCVWAYRGSMLMGIPTDSSSTGHQQKSKNLSCITEILVV